MARRNRIKAELAALPKEIQASVIIESLDQEGRGVAHVDGKTIFIDGALPTEKVTYQITRSKSSYAFANVAEVIKQSNQRVTPKCPHFGLCGGCKLQHLDFAAQVAAKQRLLEADLWHIGKVKPENMLTPLYGPTWGYRHKARLSVKYVQKKERVLVGFNEKGTRAGGPVGCGQRCAPHPVHQQPRRFARWPGAAQPARAAKPPQYDRAV